MNRKINTSIVVSLAKCKQASRLLLVLMLLDWVTPLAVFGFRKSAKSNRAVKNLPSLHTPSAQNVLNTLGNTIPKSPSVKKKNSGNLNKKEIPKPLTQEPVENKKLTQQPETNIHNENILQSSNNEEVLYDREKEKENDVDPGGGPASPEFSSFESVSTDDMVNLFSGDFTYNLPLLEVPGAHNGGYPLALTYSNITSPDQEASWVGFGWNLNPGAINRMLRGFPDDIDGGEVEYINNTPANWTASVAPKIGLEAFTVKASISKNFRYNNYKGFGGGYTASISALSGLVSLKYTLDDGQGSFSPSINPAALLSALNQAKELKQQIKDKKADKETDKAKRNENLKASRNSRREDAKKNAHSTANKNTALKLLPALNFHAFSDVGVPSNVAEYSGISTTYQYEGEADPLLVIVGGNFGVIGTYTRQKSVESRLRNAYGYLYSGKALADPNYIMDYCNEKPSPFTMRDNYSPVPISNADYFSVSGEGIGGGFRAYSNKPGLFFEPKSYSNMTQVNAGGELQFGTALGSGGNLSVGTQSLESKPDWDDNGLTNSLLFPGLTAGDESFFFRMNNDMGGYVTYPNNYDLLQADIKSSSIVGDDYKPEFPNAIMPSIINANCDNGSRSGRANNIRFFTNKQITDEKALTLANPALPKIVPDYFIGTGYIDRDNVKIQNQIGLYEITNEGGMQYVYALPVYNKNDESMQYNIHHGHNGTDLIYADISKTGIFTGDKKKYSYANSYLLTSIRSPDYADLNTNGNVDDEDLGGYTKFDYCRVFGSDDKTSGTEWYHWRSPYNGVQLGSGKLWDLADDMGSYSSGEKEVYYLKKIETKTHVAVFVTNESNYSTIYTQEAKGSGWDRKDGLSAYKYNDRAANTPPINGDQRSEYLEKIILYAKHKVGADTKFQIVKTIRFKYDYSAWLQTNGNDDAHPDSTGKLTLKKVWVENYEIHPIINSPFEFEYTYPTDATNATTGYPEKYLSTNVATFYDQYQLSQKPSYPDGKDVDRWGNYQKNGETRRQQMNPYVSQVPDADFDPAAWNLKQIKLPTGAEIHVQYEQDDYTHVQNEIATAMMSIKSFSNSDNLNEYTIKLSDFYGNPYGTADAFRYYLELLKYVADNEYVYFKFLYTLIGTNMPILPVNGCSSEYIDGYVKISQVSWNNGDITLKLGDLEKAKTINGSVFKKHDFKYPRYVCYDFIKTETGWQAGACNEEGDNYGSEMGKDKFKEFVLKAWHRWTGKMSTIDGNDNICAYINPDFSYFKLPVMPTFSLPGKKGGGLRVKRLLMYDPGLDLITHTDRSLYGTEYSYVNIDSVGAIPVSTGVAANEPQEGREENPLIQFLEKKRSQKWSEKVLSGKDKEQFEGPYGESFLPAPSVGYAKVTTESIHSGKTDAGFSVNQFYTTREFPSIGSDIAYNIDGQDMHPTTISGIHSIPFDFAVPLIVYNEFIHKIWTTQGYRFITSNYNGKPFFEAKYTGANSGVLSLSKNSAVYTKTYEYFAPGEKVWATGDILHKPTKQPLGVETEIISERKFIYDYSISTGLDFDAAVGLPFPVLSAMALLNFTVNKTKFSSLTTTKVINIPVISKRTTETKDGVMHVTENEVFNQYTGLPIITKSYDVYHGLTLNGVNEPHTFYSYSQPACGAYRGMNQKAINENLEMTVAGKVEAFPDKKYTTLSFNSPLPYPTTHAFSEGDLLELRNTTGKYYFYVKGTVEFPLGTFTRYVEKYNQSDPYPDLTTNLISFDTLKLIRSGKANRLNEPAANINTYNPLERGRDTILPSLENLRIAVINSMNTNKLSSNHLPLTSQNIYDTDNDKRFKGATGHCLVCTCASNSSSKPTVAPGCQIRLGTYNIDTVLYLAILDPRNSTSPYTAPDTSGTPLYKVANRFTLNRIPCKETTKPLLINFQKLGAPGGVFILDSVTQYNVLYCPPGEEAVVIKILDWCNPARSLDSFENVLSNNVITFRQKWDSGNLVDYKNQLFSASDRNVFENNIRGKWRSDESYVYKEPRTTSNPFNTAKVHNTGIYKMKHFGWITPAGSPEWIRASDIVAYSPFGEPVEEVDALDIPSTSVYTNDKTMPKLVASNADHNSVYFESFEEHSFGSGTVLSLAEWNEKSEFSHSGNNSIKFSPTGTPGIYGYIFIDFILTKRLASENIIVRFWASNQPKYGEPSNELASSQLMDINQIRLELQFHLPSSAYINIPFKANKINSSGVWSLFEAKINLSDYSPATIPNINSLIGTSNLLIIKDSAWWTYPQTPLNIISGSPTIYIDDVRIQPESTSMTCYVYDQRNKRLVTSFDDRHFGLYYQYNPEGKLTGKLVETERGIKMIEERQYNNAKKKTE